MRDDHQRAGVLTEHLLQRAQRGQVEVIAGFVEQEQLRRRPGVQHRCQRRLQAFATAERGHGPQAALGIQAEQGQLRAQRAFVGQRMRALQ